MTTTRPEHTELYVVEADAHEWPPMVAAARALEHEGNDAAAVEELGGEVLVSCRTARALTPDGRRPAFNRSGEPVEPHRVERHEARQAVRRRGDLMLLVADIEAAVKRVRPPWE